MQDWILKKQVLRPLAEKRGLDTCEKIVNFIPDVDCVTGFLT